MSDRYCQRDGILPQRRYPAVRAAEARRLTLLRRLGLRKAGDDKADPKRIAAVGKAVRARLAGSPRVEALGGEEADLFAVRGFVPPDLCDSLRKAIERQAEPSPLFNDGGSGRTDIRTSSTNYFRDDPAAAQVGPMIDALLGIGRSHGETLQGQRYRAGEFYRQHTDTFVASREHWQRERLRGGQRTWTAMIYLNDVERGGATEFPRLGLAIRPERGLLLAWDNHDRRGRPSRALLHAGAPVEAGTKYIATQWYRLESWQRYTGG